MIRKITTMLPANCGYNCVYRYIIQTSNPGLNCLWVKWLVANCKKAWGWHWENNEDNNNCLISFEDEKEASWFALNYDFKKDLQHD